MLACCNRLQPIQQDPEGAEVELTNPQDLPTCPTIVHADMIERVATIRFGHDLGEASHRTGYRW